MRRAEAGEGGDEIDAAGVGDLRGERLDIARGLDDAEAVAQPLHDRARDEDAAFQRVFRAVADAPRDRREQIVLRGDGLGAGVHQHEAAGAVGVLHHAGPRASLAEERRLLVARDARDGNRRAEMRCLAIDLGGRAHLRQHGARNAEEREQVVVPVAGVDVEEHGARGVARVGDVNAPAGELPDKPRVNRAERQLAALGPRLRAGDVIQQPLEFRAGEIRVQHKSRLAADERGLAGALELVAGGGGAAVLPDDGVGDGPARGALPHDGRLALVGDTDGGDVIGGEAGLEDGVGSDVGLRGPDFVGVVLHPAGLGKNLPKLLLRHGDDGASVVEDDGARTSGALVGAMIFKLLWPG